MSTPLLIGLLAITAAGQATNDTEKIEQRNVAIVQALNQVQVGSPYPPDLRVKALELEAPFVAVLNFSVTHPTEYEAVLRQEYFLLIEGQWRCISSEGMPEANGPFAANLGDADTLWLRAFILNRDKTVVKKVVSSAPRSQLSFSSSYELALNDNGQDLHSILCWESEPCQREDPSRSGDLFQNIKANLTVRHDFHGRGGLGGQPRRTYSHTRNSSTITGDDWSDLSHINSIDTF